MLFCFALREEATPFLEGTSGRAGISILITGIGQQNAQRSIRDFLQTHSPQQVFTCGFAGGLNPELKVGDVVFEIPSRSSRGLPRRSEAQAGEEAPSSQSAIPSFAQELRRAGGNRQSAIESEPPDVGCYNKLLAAGAKPAKFFCADRIATTVAEKKTLRDATGADAVEMESEAIHAACRERGIPCATVRVISDPADEDLPLDFNQLARPDLSLDYGKLAWAIAKSPGKIGALRKLQKQSQAAAERLAEVLVKILPA